MSEYTTVYLRNKNTPLLEYREYPSNGGAENLSNDDIMRIICETEEYNRTVRKSFGCELFHLSTTPSRELDLLLWSSSPRVLTIEMLDRILDFYNGEIEEYKDRIAKHKVTITKLETRILKAKVELYDKISKDIDEYNESIGYLEEELEGKQYLYNKFNFVKGILDKKSNLEDYELIYTKC